MSRCNKSLNCCVWMSRPNGECQDFSVKKGQRIFIQAINVRANKESDADIVISISYLQPLVLGPVEAAPLWRWLLIPGWLTVWLVRWVSATSSGLLCSLFGNRESTQKQSRSPFSKKFLVRKDFFNGREDKQQWIPDFQVFDLSEQWGWDFDY